MPLTVSDNPFVYPQRPATPIATNYLRDEAASLEIVEKEASGQQRVINIGSPIPIVFGEFTVNSGGVWVLPAAARYGLQIRDQSNSGFSFGVVISEGIIGQISSFDIYKGTFRLSDLPGAALTNAYGFMPEDGYNYSFSETITTPGSPGTDDQINRGEQTFTINQNNFGQWVTSNFVPFVTRSSTRSINVSLSVSSDYYQNDPTPYEWRVMANNILVGSGSSGGGSTSFSYDAGVSSGWSFDLKRPSSSSPSPVKLIVTGTGTRDTATVVPGEPSIPPSYTTTGLPLFAGAGGTFEGMSCLAARAEYSVNADANGLKEQMRCFVRNGMEVLNVRTGSIKSSNNFIDLAYYLLKQNKVSDALIDIQGFQDAHAFLTANGLRFNGVVAASTNLREYFDAVAPGLMLKFVQDAGQFSFKPVLPVDSDFIIDSGSIEPVKTFTNNNIIAGSYTKSFYSTQRRKPFCALVSWREQFRQSYSTVISTEFRYVGSALDGPFETYDYSDFITDANHASIVGNYIISSRARTTHSIRFLTYFDSEVVGQKLAGQLEPLDVIRVNVDNETTSLNANSQLTSVSDQYYQVMRITESGAGQIEVEAIHFPSDESGASLIASDIFAAVPPIVPNPIPGVTPDPTDPDPPGVGIGILSISPPLIPYSQGTTVSFTVSYSGPATDVVFFWQGPAGTSADLSTTGNTLTWVAGGADDAGAYTVSAISATSSDSGKQISAVLEYQPFYDATGGAISYDGDFKIHTFTSSGQFSITKAPSSGTLEYLIVGAGGAGNEYLNFGGGGGGGGGGVISRNATIAASTYQINVGRPATYGQAKSSANHSSAFGQIAYCGGDGSIQVQSLADGGSGGGGPADVPFFDRYVTGNGVGGQGNRGGTGAFGADSSNISIGGGGGAASAGTGGSASVNSTTGGSGGQGLSSSISGSSYVYGSGGGGLGSGTYNVTGGSGGTGAGTGARRYYSNGWKSDENTRSTNYGAGGSGGGGANRGGVQGIVIIRYRYQ